MTKIAVAPLFLTNYLMELGEDNYEAHLDTVSFDPSSSTQTWTGGDGESYTAGTVATWTVGLGFAQDWETPESLSILLHESEGETLPAKFRPKSGSGPSFTSNVTITPGRIGGTVNQFAGSTVTLGSTRPVIEPVTP